MFDEAFITTICNRMKAYEDNLTRLTKENESLKLLLERSRFTAEDILEIFRWNMKTGGAIPRASTQGSCHGQGIAPQSSGRSPYRTLHDHTHTSRIDRLASLPSPIPGDRHAKSTTWPEFVSRSTSPIQSTTVSRNITPTVANREEMRGSAHKDRPRSLLLNETVQIPPREGVKKAKASFSDSVRAWRRQMFPALSRGDSALVMRLFDQGCPIDLVHIETRETPLVAACRLGNVDLARECLNRGALIDPHPGFGQSALHAAVSAGQEACVRLVLETASCDTVVSNHVGPDQETLLHAASRHGCGGIVDMLLYYGADLSVVGKDGTTPLHMAARYGNVKALASLLDAGGDAVIEVQDHRGNSALHVAAAHGHTSCVKMLLGTAAEPDIPNMDGNTPFTLASIGGHLAVTGLILQYAPDARRGSRRKGHAQMRELTSRWNCVTSDTLPRPHMRTSSLSTRPNNPEQPRRHLAKREYSATYARKKENENGRGSFRESIVPKPGLREGGENAPSDVQIYGSLFDGMHVYVTGDRQPLGLQRQVGSVGKCSSETCSTTDRKSTRCNDQHSSKQPQSSCQHPHSLRSISSEATTVAIQWEDGSAAPSTLASESPRGDLMSSPSHGVDEGEVGSEKHSNLSSPTLTCEDVASTREWMDSRKGEPGGAMRPWIMLQDQRARVNNSVHFPDRNAVGGNNVETDRASRGTIGDDMHAERTENALQDEVANEDKRHPQYQNSFELSSSESNGLSGRWWIFYSEGYPYYQHEESGHSQWEDPRYHPFERQQS